MLRRALPLLLIACGSNHPAVVPVASPVPDAGVAPPADAAPPGPATPIADAYRDVAAQLLAAATADDAAWQRLRELTDTIGNRLSGTEQLDQAIQWAAAAMKADGQDVTTEKVMVPHWVRGAERARLVAPIDRDLVMIGLGGSVGTPKKGITAPVVAVKSWDELAAKKDQVKGAIVLYDVAMPDTGDAMADYGAVFDFRWAGASEAAKLGAVAMLMRSVTNHSLRTPHTGTLNYDEQVKKIPAAAITVEDAELIERLSEKGPVKVHLEMGAKALPDVESANVIGEIEGTSDEVVVIGAHLDSWDVGQGAQDDGTGVVAVMQALKVIRDLGLHPRRTIRVVLWTNEENGLKGGLGYATAHQAELAKHAVAIEMDEGGYTPLGFDVDKQVPSAAQAVPRVQDLVTLLAPLGATRARAGDGDIDTIPLARSGVPTLALAVDDRRYFDVHHTQADTLDKVDPKELAQDVAALAVAAFVIADMPGRLDDP